LYLNKNMYIIIVLVAVILFLVFFTSMLLYKLRDVNWYHQLMSGQFTDKDLFTKFVKFILY
jgi:hypothetical protein